MNAIKPVLHKSGRLTGVIAHLSFAPQKDLLILTGMEH